jgi:hypothetical protein
VAKYAGKKAVDEAYKNKEAGQHEKQHENNQLLSDVRQREKQRIVKEKRSDNDKKIVIIAIFSKIR